MSFAPSLIAIAAFALQPSSAGAAESCPRQPLPPAIESAGFPEAERDQEEVRFSAAPSFSRIAYAVRLSRPNTADRAALVHVVRLVRQLDCNRYDRPSEWRFSLGPDEAARLFDQLRSLEESWRPDDTIVLDGTRFSYEHRTAGGVVRITPSSSAEGQSGRLSLLLLSVARRGAADLPMGADWTDRAADAALEPAE